MARLLLYLHARDDDDRLLSAARSLVDWPPLVDGSISLALLAPQAEDPLAVPADSALRADTDLVLELVAQAGQPLLHYRDAICGVLAAVLAEADGARSHVFHDYPRCFRANGPKPLRYHYLMVRRADFSRADYLHYYSQHHYRFGVASPLADYFQGYGDPAGSEAWAGWLGLQAIAADNLSELRFDDLDAYLYSDRVVREIGPAAAADEERFVDRAASVSFSMTVLLDTAAQ